MTDSMEAIRLKREQAKARKNAANTADEKAAQAADNEEQTVSEASAETTETLQTSESTCTADEKSTLTSAEAQLTKKPRKKPSDTVKMTSSGERIYTPTQTAAILQTTPQTIHARIKAGRIAAVKFGPRMASHITETEINRLRAEWNII